MTSGIPTDLARLRRSDAQASAIRHELQQEAAASLGRQGRRVQAALDELRMIDGRAEPARRAAALYAAADVVWKYFVQREMMGLLDHAPVIEAYSIPREVLAKVGASPPAAR